MSCVLLAGFCLAAATGTASAQVRADESALDALPQAQKKPEDKKAQKPHQTQTRRVAVKPQGRAQGKPASAGHNALAAAVSAPAAPQPAPARRPPPAATIPPAPPPVPVLTPPEMPVDLHPFPMPADPPVVKDAKGSSAPVPGGVRLVFGEDSSDLNEEMRTAILAFVKILRDQPDTRALVDACGSGAPNDPSRPRRKALARGLAVRAVLMNAGIPSTRIYVRVKGPPDDEIRNVPDDRVDLRRSDTIP
ncbi:hypothetical protein LOC54_04670 [Acetobacter sp. AN02]|uniref:OmpA family protein n=1 Tax=Acetobacter sp. AN02 TaxID=2894186 RepID=UPI0024344ABE|nr:OmpA family protein [Acetobacter sp. AN02]MDG6094412.1 hypothetical protein [Acetobacter sp. AN02]